MTKSNMKQDEQQLIELQELLIFFLENGFCKENKEGCKFIGKILNFYACQVLHQINPDYEQNYKKKYPSFKGILIGEKLSELVCKLLEQGKCLRSRIMASIPEFKHAEEGDHD